jgi:hypothetical protein
MGVPLVTLDCKTEAFSKPGGENCGGTAIANADEQLLCDRDILVFAHGVLFFEKLNSLKSVTIRDKRDARRTRYSGYSLNIAPCHRIPPEGPARKLMEQSLEPRLELRRKAETRQDLFAVARGTARVVNSRSMIRLVNTLGDGEHLLTLGVPTSSSFVRRLGIGSGNVLSMATRTLRV